MKGLDQAAQDIADYNGETGNTGHSGKNESRMGERMNTYGKWDGKVGEIICVLPVNGLDFVLNWMIGDGEKNRWNRLSLIHI